MWLRGRDLNPRPLGYEPNFTEQPGTIRTHSMRFSKLFAHSPRPRPTPATTDCQPIVSRANVPPGYHAECLPPDKAWIATGRRAHHPTTAWTPTRFAQW
jgi:hypothetical protein